jgi:flagellar biosynthesis protein FlhG
VNDQAKKLRELAERGVFDNGIAVAAPPEATIDRKEKSRCVSVAVTGGKGGVGKTNVALFIAVAIARMKKRVLLLDADLGLANVHILLGAAPRFNLSHMVRGECTINEALWKGPAGIDVLPGASGIEAMANLDRTGVGRLRSTLAEFECAYDYFIMDTAAGIGDSVTQFASRADLPLLLLTPEPTALADAYATAKVLYERGAQRIAVIVNMASSDREGTETFDRLNTLVVKFLQKGLTFFGCLPFDREVVRYIKRQQLVVLEDPLGRFSEKIQAVAWKLTGLPPPPDRRGFFARFWGDAGKKEVRLPAGTNAN